MKKIVMSLGLALALLVGGAVTSMAAMDKCPCCTGDCHCPCCQK